MAAALGSRARAGAAGCIALAVLVLAAGYAWLAAEHGTVALWDVIVHESGRYTFGETVLYFAHFLREVPTDIAYALFLLGAGGRVARGPDAIRPAERGRARLVGWLALAVAALLVVGATVATARHDGLDSALRDLLQYRTRDDLVAYGSHWRFHWLSTIWFGATVMVLAAVVARLTGGRAIGRSAFWERVAWGYFVVLTLVFGLSTDVFVDTRYVGHQAREILTHGPVTALLGIGLLIGLRQWLGADAEVEARSRQPWFHTVAMVVIPVYLAATALTGDVMTAGQSDHGLVAMVAAHYFEHALDYALTTLLVIAALGLDVAYRQMPRQSLSGTRPANADRTPVAR